jgi:hypothetical protein
MGVFFGCDVFPTYEDPQIASAVAHNEVRFDIVAIDARGICDDLEVMDDPTLVSQHHHSSSIFVDLDDLPPNHTDLPPFVWVERDVS